MWKAPADHQALQLSSAKIPGSHGLSEGLNCANCYIHRAFSHPHISALFKGPGNSSAHRTAALCVSHLTFCVHVPPIAIKAPPPPRDIQQGGFCFCEVPKTLFVLYSSSPSSSCLDCEVCAASTVPRERAFSLSACAGFTGSSIHVHSLPSLPKKLAGRRGSGSLSYRLLLEATMTDPGPDRFMYSIICMPHSALDCQRAKANV